LVAEQSKGGKLAVNLVSKKLNNFREGAIWQAEEETARTLRGS
jgi:hypothetical protein